MFKKIYDISNQYIGAIENLKENIDLIFNLIDSLDNTENLDSDKKKYRDIVNKIFVIDIYSAWEQFVKKEIEVIYEEYKNILISNNRIISNIFNDELKRMRKVIVNDHAKLDLKSVFVNTNNLKYLSLKKLLKNIDVDLNSFNNKLIEEDLQIILVEMNDLRISRYIDETYKSESRELANVINTIFTIVQTRNEYSHTGRARLYFNQEQMLKYCEFFKSLIQKITDYLVEQMTIKKGIHYSNYDSVKIEVIEVLHENSPHRNEMSCALKIKSRKKIKIDSKFELLIKDSSGSTYFFAKNLSVEDTDENEIDNIIKGEQYIKFNTECKIRREKLIELYAYHHKPELTMIKLS
jgi:hypothetical protein